MRRTLQIPPGAVPKPTRMVMFVATRAPTPTPSGQQGNAAAAAKHAPAAYQSPGGFSFLSFSQMGSE